MPRRYLDYIEALRGWRREHTVYQDLVVFDAETGRPGPAFCNYGHMSMAKPAQPPAVTPQGLLAFPMNYEHWSPCIGLFEALTGRLRSVVVPRNYVNGDEHHNFSFGGDVLFSIHFCEGRGTPASTEAYDLGAGRRIDIGLRKMSPAGRGEGGIGGVKSAPPGNSASISGDMFFHVCYHSVGAWRGR